MKHFTKTFVFALFAIFALTNCESKSIPANLNSLPIKRYILGQCFYGDELWYHIMEMFDPESRIKKQFPQDYVPRNKYSDLRECCYLTFRYNVFPCSDLSDKDEMVKNLKNSLPQDADYTDSELKTIKRLGLIANRKHRLNENELKQEEEICLNLIDEFDTFFSDLAAKKITLLDCIPDSKSKSKAFQAYWTIYELGSGFYILAYYTEFTNSNKYTLEIKYKGESLSELNAYLK